MGVTDGELVLGLSVGEVGTAVGSDVEGATEGGLLGAIDGKEVGLKEGLVVLGSSLGC